jgi:tRNA pseudouridine55 synthase
MPMVDNNLSGFLLIDKPAGISSFDVIRQLRRQTGIKTFGHAGTLDPFATGLLILAVNKYTRLLPLLESSDKTYEATMELGKSTTTGDPEGEIIRQENWHIDPARLSELKTAVLQLQKLKPPAFSALKIDGQRAYQKARRNEAVDLPERPVLISEFTLIDYEYPFIKYACRVSKGTYIRSLSEWIAEFLGTVGYTTELRRTFIGTISVERAVLPEIITSENWLDFRQSALDILPGSAQAVLSAEEIRLLSQGRQIAHTGRDESNILVLDGKLECRGLAQRSNNMLQPRVNL